MKNVTKTHEPCSIFNRARDTIFNLLRPKLPHNEGNWNNQSLKQSFYIWQAPNQGNYYEQTKNKMVEKNIQSQFHMLEHKKTAFIRQTSCQQLSNKCI